ncbi:MAG: peptidase M48, partial [Polaromonas sp.]|nr:peptidase M48 [Polaromonas sp.]
ALVGILDVPAAMDRFTAAQDLMRRCTVLDHIEASIFDTRARVIELLRREQAVER